MAIAGIGAVTAISFREANVTIDRLGGQVTSQKMEEAVPQVSNFGNETKIGTSHFQQENSQLEEESISRISEIMEKDDDIMEVSNFGNETNLSPSGFQEANSTAFNPAMQRAASSYGYFNQ